MSHALQPLFSQQIIKYCFVLLKKNLDMKSAKLCFVSMHSPVVIITGRFCRYSKQACWNVFVLSLTHVIQALQPLVVTLQDDSSNYLEIFEIDIYFRDNPKKCGNFREITFALFFQKFK